MAITHLTVLGHEAVLGTCDLCAEPDVEITDTVSVRRNNRTFAVLSACERCGRATRRLSALIGHDLQPIVAETGHVQPAEPEPALAAAPHSQPQLIHQFLETVIAHGHEYLARVYGSERTDGTWVAWLVFTDPKTSEMRSTGPETSQSKQSDVAYWATGLEATYLEGAFERATEVTVSAPTGGLQPKRT